MAFLNENAGVVTLIIGIFVVAGLVATLYFLLDMRRKLAVQKVKFLGLNGVDYEGRKVFAKIVVGNKSVNDVSLVELGVKNGKVSFNLTPLYNSKKGVAIGEKIVMEQRSVVTLRLEEAELKKLFVLNKKGVKVVGQIRAYAIDSTGNLFKGRLFEVERLVKSLIKQENGGDASYVNNLFAKKEEEINQETKVVLPEPEKVESVDKPQEEVKDSTPKTDEVKANEEGKTEKEENLLKQ
ncbi:MAG: hypothetical protein E7369_00260 [Clostridiales bacterium]|nr:hypothetical protein [Clostridiales bacterium]